MLKLANIFYMPIISQAKDVSIVIMGNWFGIDNNSTPLRKNASNSFFKTPGTMKNNYI